MDFSPQVSLQLAESLFSDCETMNNTEETGGLMPRSVAEMVSKYNYMMVELRDPR